MSNSMCRSIQLRSERFDDVVRAVRQKLADADLRVSGEMDVARTMDRKLAITFAPCRILYVDCPILLFEALAFDRSAAALLPLHLVISMEAGCIWIYWVNPANLFGFRMPVASRNAIGRLEARLVQALKTMPGAKDGHVLQMAVPGG